MPNTQTNFSFVSQIKTKQQLSYKQLAQLSEYSEESVRAWFADHSSSKFRGVPDRAVTIIKMKMKSEA